MALAHREATVVWEGTLGSGAGALRETGALDGTTVDWSSNEDDANGTTSPEQLLAAAEAGCYAMTLALALTRRGNPAQRLTVAAACELDRTGGDDPQEYAITQVTLSVTGDVPGLDEATFAEVARHADAQCPISNAIRHSVEVRVEPRLASAAA
jgi:osmotically inducible protein OsmC